MGWTITAVILILVAFALTLGFRKAKGLDARSEDREPAMWASGVLATVAGVGAALILFLNSYVVVPANHAGILKSYGSYAGTASEGWKWIKPWWELDTFPTRNQQSVRDQGDKSVYNCVSVKLKGNASACVDLTVLYTIDEDRAEKLWRGWGSFTRLNEDLINRATDDAANFAYGAYGQDQVGGENRGPITTKIRELLAAKLSPHGIELNDLTLGDVHLPEEVQKRTNEVLAQDAQNRVAEGKRAQAQIDAETYAIQRASGVDPTVKLCLDAAKEIRPQIMPSCGIGNGSDTPPVIIGQRQN